MKIKMKDGSIQEAGFEEELGKNAFRHTSAHILAQAVKRLYPNTKCAIGPSTADGFYYDFDFSFHFSEENFAEIEAEMRKIVKENLQLRHFTADRDKAMQLMEERNETFKIELLRELPEGETIRFYQQGEYLEMCAGPHVAYTSTIKAFKLLSVAGAYWRGDEKKKMLTRIYGTSFPSKDMLEEYLNRLEEAKKRDHRKLGKELGLFALFDEGPGFPFFLPKGLILKNLLIDYWRKLHTREGYVEISTPMMLNRQLWETSGHWEHYRENMCTTVIDDTDFAIKPMNCPGGMLVYKMEPRSYREFPMRIGELGLIHRVVFGSIERFIGILIEHFAGKFPLWLSPVQIKILSISDKYNDYAKEIEIILNKEGLRCEMDGRSEKIGYKIREAQLERIPYMLIVGEREMETNCVSIRRRDQGDLGSMSINQFLEILREEKMQDVRIGA